jgi:hypothetical protein
MVGVVSISSSSVSAFTLASLNPVIMASLVAMLMSLVVSCAERSVLMDLIQSPEVEEELLGTNGLSPPSLGLDITNLGCSAVAREKSGLGSELDLLCLWYVARSASCWLGSQSTAADGSGMVLSSDVKDEWMLVMLFSLVLSPELGAENTESSSRASGPSEGCLLAWCSPRGTPASAGVCWGVLLITPWGELGGVGVMTLSRLFTPRSLTLVPRG